jgi:hypothetical protein
MGLFSFLEYTFIIFAAHLATSCGAFENHWTTQTKLNIVINAKVDILLDVRTICYQKYS